MSTRIRILAKRALQRQSETIESFLSGYGVYEIATVNCLDADRCQSSHTGADLFIADTRQSGSDILPFIEKIKLNPHLANTPVLAVSDDIEIASKSLDAGADDVLLFMPEDEKHAELLLRINNLLRQRITTEKLCKAKIGFSTLVSHELRTPLNGISGLTDILLDEVGDSKALEHLGELRETVNSLADIINNLLDYSASDIAVCSIPPVTFNLVTVIRQACSQIEERASAKEIVLNVEIPPELDKKLSGYPDRIRKALVNLMENAIKFAPARGVVQVIASSVNGHDSGNSFVCIIRDNGIGIDLEEFRPLLDGKDIDELPGEAACQNLGSIGIRLVVARRLARSIGGSVAAESEPGLGSSFYLAFEAQEDTAAEQASATSFTAAPARSLEILLAEDNPVNQKVASWQLAKLGHRVTIAANGMEALERWKHGAFDLVFMDLQMPVLDGFDATAAIRLAEQGSGKRTPVIALTAFGSEGSEGRCYTVGMDGFVTKPVSPAALARAISNVFEQRGDNGQS